MYISKNSLDKFVANFWHRFFQRVKTTLEEKKKIWSISTNPGYAVPANIPIGYPSDKEI